MRLFLLGLSHHTAPVELRERVSIARADLPRALATLAERPAVGEAVILSTCNRTEIYATSADPAHARDGVTDFLCEFQGLAPGLLAPHLFALVDVDVVRHLFRVAAGLDSMIVGEPQVLGQAKDAWSAAAEESRTGPLLNRLFHAAFTVGKRVRSETGIGEGSVSASATAVALARKIFGSLANLRVLLVGAGEMAKLAALHFKAQHVASLTITSRTPAHAEAVAQAIGAAARPWRDLPQALSTADIVVTATGATAPIVSRADVAQALRARPRRPLFIVDLGVPRDVEPQAGNIDDVFLYNVDDLQAIVSDNLSKRQRHLDEADAIVGEEIDRFAVWYRSRDAIPTMVALRRRFDAIRRAELSRLDPTLAGLSPEVRARVDDVTRLLVEKLLLLPSDRLKALPDEMTAVAYADALARLFNLEEIADRTANEEGPSPQHQRRGAGLGPQRLRLVKPVA